LRDLKSAAESGEGDRFAALAQQIMPPLREAEKATLRQDRGGLKAATLKPGILGVRSTPQDFRVSDPDRRTESAIIALPPIVVGDEQQERSPSLSLQIAGGSSTGSTAPPTPSWRDGGVRGRAQRPVRGQGHDRQGRPLALAPDRQAAKAGRASQAADIGRVVLADQQQGGPPERPTAVQPALDARLCDGGSGC
jgi:hypothetical protein